MAGSRGIRAGAAFVEIFADDGPLRRSLNGISARFKKVGSDLASVGSVFAGAGAAGAAALAWPLQMAANLEKTEAAFTTLLKDGNQAKRLLGELRDFAASTPLQFNEIADAAKKLIAFGTNAKDVEGELRRLGDIAGAIGVPLGEIAEIYGKARVQGRLFAEDVNQLTGRGIPVLDIFARQLGITKDQLKDAVKDGKLGFENLEQAVIELTTGTGKFAGGLKRQSQTLIGAFSTLKDNIEAAFRPFGEALLPAAKGALEIATKAIQAFTKWAERNKGLAVGIAAAVAAVSALGAAGLTASAVFFGLSTVIGAVSTAAGLIGSAVAAILSPVGAIAAAVVGIGAGLAYVANQAGLLAPAFNFMREAFGRVFGTVKVALGAIVNALASGQWGQAAAIAWAGVKLAALQGIQEILRGIEGLWNNAGIITVKFLAEMHRAIYAAFKSIPRLAFAALQGGAAFQGAVQDALGGFFSGESNFLSSQLEPAIARARQQFNVQVGAVRGRPGNQAVRQRPPGMQRPVLADPQMLAIMQRQLQLQQRMANNGGLQ